jgi:hypothetical protein
MHRARTGEGASLVIVGKVFGACQAHGLDRVSKPAGTPSSSRDIVLNLHGDLFRDEDDRLIA